MAKRRVNYTRQILSESGFEIERLRMINIGAADARPFVEHIKNMIETVRNLGPNPLNQADASPEAISDAMIKQEIQP
jgi:coenzyme F420-reducing hydrogenase delta subunit